MICLGVDYGRKRIGLALSANGFVRPIGFIVSDKEKKRALLKIGEICRRENVMKVIVGWSRGKMGLEIRSFVDELRKMVKLPVELIDETLTSWQAERMVGWRDKGKVDAVAAALILERYLDKLTFN